MTQTGSDIPFYLALSHDVDRVRKTYQYATHAVRSRSIRPLQGMLKRGNPYWTFPRIRKLEEDLGVRSTFFFMEESGHFDPLWPGSAALYVGRYRLSEPEIRREVLSLDECGWEVGLHGSYRSATDMNLLRKEKNALESILGHPVTGTRQHYLNLSIPSTWSGQKHLGFSYDASLDMQNPARQVRIHGSTGLLHPLGDEFIEVPLDVMDRSLFTSFSTVPEAKEHLLRIVELAEERGGVFSVLWHTERFYERDFPGQTVAYKSLVEAARSRGAFVGSIRDVIAKVRMADSERLN